jgi:predicted RNA-binding protein with PUA-like domain
MAYWLLRSEPSTYGWDDLIQERRTEWTGVKNHTAAINLRAMAPGDEAIFYHSNEGKEAVGIMRVTRAAQPDSTDAKWVSVEVEAVRPLEKPVGLAAMKAEPKLAEMQMLRQSRLSVSKVTTAEWQVVLAMAKS